jgi:hypothetical protein
MGLSSCLPGAFTDCPPCPPPCSVYFHVGAQSLQRQNMGHRVIALTDVPGPNTQNGRPGPGLDTGLVPSFISPVAVDTNNVSQNFQWGVRATVGYLDGNNAIELTGFYLPQNASTQDVINPGRLSAYFFNPPINFEGNNGLWLQADHIQTRLQTQLGNAELNYRCWNSAVTCIEPILGVRYFDLSERLGIFTDDDGILVRDIFGNPDPVRQATYLISSHSHIVAPQLGFEFNYPVLSCLTLGCTGKGAWGANFVNVGKRLTRGDGTVGFNGSTSDTIFSQMYEINAFLDLSLFERVRVRGGYTAMWVVDVPDAARQVTFDLANQFTGKTNNNGSIFYHGPMVELQILF